MTYLGHLGLRTIRLYGYGRTIDSYMTVTVSPYTVCLVYLKILQRVWTVVETAVYGSTVVCTVYFIK